MGLAELTEHNFQQLVQSGCFFVHFWTPWCRPCFEQEEELSQFSKVHPATQFGRVNAEENPNLAEQYEIYVFPTLLIFRNGKVVKKLVGMHPESSYKSFTV